MNFRFLSTLGLALITTASLAQQKKPAAKTPAAKTAMMTTPGGTKLVEKVTRQPGQVMIPY
ncbi:MAG: hypothetical protein H7330_04700, partial [Hymenobacteraceae bacterium]|nr:hypothetical protein [Hymenobacteraceae bacterium]